METSTTRWRAAWLALACALALHVTDEALTGFLPIYNANVAAIRSALPWVPVPTFTFPVWLGGLALAIALLVALTPVVTRGARWIRIASIVLGTIMTANGLLHIGTSIVWGRLAPGATSSPVLIVAAVALVVTAARAGHPLTPSAGAA